MAPEVNMTSAVNKDGKIQWRTFVLYCHIEPADIPQLLKIKEDIRAILKRTTDEHGLLVLFLDTGLRDLLRMIHPIKRELNMIDPDKREESRRELSRTSAKQEKQLLKNDFYRRSEHLKRGEDKGRDLEQWLGEDVRVLTALDLVDVFGEMSDAENLKKFLTGTEGEIRYDTPKFVESIVRLRIIGSHLPVLRLDRDVLIPPDSEPFNGGMLKSAITQIRGAVGTHHANTQILATILSANYQTPSENDDSVLAWSRGFGTRILPSLLLPQKAKAKIYIEALKLEKTIKALKPENGAEALKLEEAIKALKLGKFSEALKLLEKVSKALKPEKISEALKLEEAIKALKLGKFSEAPKLLEEVSEALKLEEAIKTLKPEKVSEALKLLEEVSKALKPLEEAIKAPELEENTKAYNLLHNLLKNINEARKLLEEVIKVAKARESLENVNEARNPLVEEVSKTRETLEKIAKARKLLEKAIDWKFEMQDHFRPELTEQFLDNLWKWGAPKTAVISGALLYMNDAVVLNVPPFSNFSQRVMWIDDHLRYVLHREMGDFCRQTQSSQMTNMPLHVFYEDVKIPKYRPAENFLLYTVRTYLPSLLWGSFFDYWLCPSKILKRRWEAVKLLSEKEQTDWVTQRLDGCPGILAAAVREARAGCLPDEGKLRDDLKKDANVRLEMLHEIWGKLQHEGRESLASAWVHDAFPQSLKDALTSGTPKIDTRLPETVEQFRNGLEAGFNELLDDTCRYVKWVFEWPHVVSVIRSVPPGEFRSDLGWPDSPA
jgi:tetratricopeptide (TPR) repeat protein